MKDTTIVICKKKLIKAISLKVLLNLILVGFIYLSIFLFVVKNNILSFFIAPVLVERIWRIKKGVDLKIKTINMVLYIRKIELNQIKVDTENNTFKKIKKILNP